MLSIFQVSWLFVIDIYHVFIDILSFYILAGMTALSFYLNYLLIDKIERVEKVKDSGKKMEVII